MAPPNLRTEGPCDIYEAAGTPCVAAYSTVRALLSTYEGPLYQVRSGSSTMNTGTGGQTHDIGITAEGFADAAAQDAACAGSVCTVSKLYDQSGKGNDLTVAKKGNSSGGDRADEDDWETVADDGPISVGGHDVYSLYMDQYQGYRQTVKGNGTPRGTAPQGIYMLADGTHYGTECCWEFGNVTEDPTTYHVMNSLFFGTAYWGRGAGSGPWFMADFEAGVWAGGSAAGQPGWGDLAASAAERPANPDNPSLKVPFAIGFLKTNQTNYGLSMANLETANALSVAYEGALPKAMDNQGAIVLGVAGDNSNNSWGTFFEGAVVAGYPSGATELAVMQNVKAAGYGN
jgi:non-reducing end alpha-L-arabinofuranosidase